MSAGTAGLAIVDAAVGAAAPLPHDNGELVFEEPWQGRTLGMGVVSWEDFRHHLVVAIAARPPRDGESAATAYYAAGLDALEALLVDRGLLRSGG